MGVSGLQVLLMLCIGIHKCTLPLALLMDTIFAGLAPQFVLLAPWIDSGWTGLLLRVLRYWITVGGTVYLNVSLSRSRRANYLTERDFEADLCTAMAASK